jgi:GAF domain-containing protein
MVPAKPSQLTGLLADRMIALAGTPDDSAQVSTDFLIIAKLAAAQLAAVEATSVTVRRGDGFVTVAASDDIAVAADETQYEHDAGPCLDALRTERPVAVAEIATARGWPAFRATAATLGLTTSLSIPLFAGSGTILGGLNLYSRQPGAMATISAAVSDAYAPESSTVWDHDDLDDGGRDLIAGVIGALALRSMIQQAIRMLMSTTAGSAELAYRSLRKQAAETGTGLIDTAARLIEQKQPGP